MLKPIMEWNTTKKIWQLCEENLLSEPLVPFLETWPTSGMMRDGKVFELQMPVRHTIASESSSLLRTPSVTDSTGGAISEKQAVERGRMLKLADQSATLAFYNGLKVSPSIEASLLPTPLSRDHKEGYNPHYRDGVLQTDNVPRAVMHSGEVTELSWGRYEPAIRRWEEVTGRKAPAATRPDGRDGAHRLNPELAEWMMGLEPGWITGAGLTRTDELKACGNGVVPQQAELALAQLLDGVDW